MWVSPFRNLRINGYLLLPEAFRSLSRLSSALSAKASTLRSFQHNQLDSECGFERRDNERLRLELFKSFTEHSVISHA